MSATKPCLKPKLSKYLAEEIGIHIGGGSMREKNILGGMNIDIQCMVIKEKKNI